MPAETHRDPLAGHESGLIPCALRAADSGGREHGEADHPYRSCYQRDRDRIVHCSAFRRLAYKTQVFVPHEQDHCRTRLTHTLEVSQVARTLARAIGANDDVAEAVALAHDLGHPPFGHAGERALNELMADHGHFEHNRQTLRVVDYLEHPYSDFRGLNLTGAVVRCLAKHQAGRDAPAGQRGDGTAQVPLEGQLVDLADEIAYTSADVYDALSAEWIRPEQMADLSLWRRAWEMAAPAPRAIHQRIQACRNVLAIMADDVIAETGRRIGQMRLNCPDDVLSAGRPCAAFSQERAPQVGQFQEFLHERVYRHPKCLAEDARARQIMAELFAAYVASPSRLPPRYARRVDGNGIHRVACDYIAGMTDRYCRNEHARLTGTPR